MSLRSGSRLAWLGGAAAVTLSGCVVEIEFTPLGNDFAIDGSWTLNGAAPTTSSCAAAGIAEVGVVFWDGATKYDYDQFVFPCSAGSFSTEKVLAWGSYEAQWVAYDATGGLVAESDRFDIAVVSPTARATIYSGAFVVDVPTTLNVSFLWGTAGAPTTGTDCATAGVSLVYYRLTVAGGGAEVDEGTDLACPPALEWSEITAGSYELYFEGEDAAGGKHWQGTCTGLTVVDGQANAYTCTGNYS